MERTPVLLAMLLCSVAATAGCIGGGGEGKSGFDTISECGSEPAKSYTFYLDEGHSLVASNRVPEEGMVSGNGFAEAFLTDDMDEWLSEPLDEGMWIQGEVTIEFWARNVGTPAPIMIGGGPGEGYHFFNQFGSDLTFQPAYAIEYASAVPLPGSVDHYTEVLAMPEGGFVVEKGDRLRLLLTSLVLDDADGGGHDILFGGDTPSKVSFKARCYADRIWLGIVDEAVTVSLLGNRGLLTGAIPAEEGLNTLVVPFNLRGDTQRLTISLEQANDRNPLKDDMDLTIEDASGNEVWSIGTPYSNESGTLWAKNLEAVMPPGDYQVRVNSYSGFAYDGLLRIVQEIIA